MKPSETAVRKTFFFSHVFNNLSLLRSQSLKSSLPWLSAVSSVLRSMSDPPPPSHHLNSGYRVISRQTVQSEALHETPQLRASGKNSIVSEALRTASMVFYFVLGSKHQTLLVSIHFSLSVLNNSAARSDMFWVKRSFGDLHCHGCDNCKHLSTWLTETDVYVCQKRETNALWLLKPKVFLS